MPLLAHMLNQGEPALIQAQPQEVSPPLPSPVVEPHPSIDPMPSPPRQSSPSPILFGPAPSSGVASTDPIPDIPSSSRPSEPVLETITSLIRDDDTGGSSFPERPPSPSPATLTRSPTVGVAEEPLTLISLLALFPTCLKRIATLEAELKATKILHGDAVVLFAKRIKKLESKLKTKKRKLVLSDSENEEDARQCQEQSSPSPIPFGPAPSSGVASTDPIPDIPSSSRPSEPVLETITSLIRDDDTGGSSFPERPPSPSPATLTRSPTVGVAEELLTLISLLALFPTCLKRIATLKAELKATKILHRDAVVLFAKRIKKLESKLKT
nr:hypothetical protein [Tanacetum cinerariifolium]